MCRRRSHTAVPASRRGPRRRGKPANLRSPSRKTRCRGSRRTAPEWPLGRRRCSSRMPRRARLHRTRTGRPDPTEPERGAPRTAERPPHRLGARRLLATRAPFSLGGASSRLSGARPSQRDASLWLRDACLKRSHAPLSQRDASLWLRDACLKRSHAPLSQRDASLWLRDASSDRARSLPSSPDASPRPMGPRKRARSSPPSDLRAPLWLGRAVLHGRCASLKLRDARRRRPHTLLEKSDGAREQGALRPSMPPPFCSARSGDQRRRASPAPETRRSVSVHKRSASTSSSAAAPGGFSFASAKYRPEISAASGAVAR
jgi:hypothetical protein